MANYERHSTGLPMIVKFVEHFHNGVQSHTLSRYAIGYIVRGEKHIYNGDKRQTISKGDVFFLGIGTHYTEEVPDESNTFDSPKDCFGCFAPDAFWWDFLRSM